MTFDGFGVHNHANLFLDVPFDRRLAGPAVRLTPDQGQFLSVNCQIRPDGCERDAGALRLGIGWVERHTDVFTFQQDAIAGRNGLVSNRQFDFLIAVACRESAGIDVHDILLVPDKSHLLEPVLRRYGLKRFATNEIMVELGHAAIAQILRCPVIVLDVASGQ